MVIIHGEIGNVTEGVQGVTLENVIAQVKAQPEGSITADLKSNGGSVQVGDDIYNYLTSLKREIIIKATGNVDSIATKILLAGTKRIGYKGITTSMIHTVGYTLKEQTTMRQDDFEFLGVEAKALNEQMAKFYASKTGHTIEAFVPLMRDEKELNDQEMFELGFLTEVLEKKVETRAVAYKSIEKMSTVTKKEFEAKSNALENLINRIGKKLGIGATNLVVQTAVGEGETALELEFPDLADDATPAVGDMATVDGSPATGTHVMPSGETYVFEAGALTEIIPEESDEEVTALKQEVEAQKAKIAELEATNKKNLKVQAETATALKEISTEFTNFKKIAGSNFTSKSEKKANGSDNNQKTDQPKKRSLFKAEA